MKFNPNEVTWRDTSDITLLACLIEEAIENTDEQYNLFLKYENNPDIIDLEIVNRTVKLAVGESVFIEIYEEQLNRWRKENLTTVQENKINRISQELEKYRNFHEEYFDLVKDLSGGPIEEIDDDKIESEENDLKSSTGESPDPLK